MSKQKCAAFELLLLLLSVLCKSWHQLLIQVRCPASFLPELMTTRPPSPLPRRHDTLFPTSVPTTQASFHCIYEFLSRKICASRLNTWGRSRTYNCNIYNKYISLSFLFLFLVEDVYAIMHTHSRFYIILIEINALSRPWVKSKREIMKVEFYPRKNTYKALLRIWFHISLNFWIKYEFNNLFYDIITNYCIAKQESINKKLVVETIWTLTYICDWAWKRHCNSWNLFYSDIERLGRSWIIFCSLLLWRGDWT